MEPTMHHLLAKAVKADPSLPTIELIRKVVELQKLCEELEMCIIGIADKEEELEFEVKKAKAFQKHYLALHKRSVK